jgi:DNA-repair protein complementing XP-A cells
MRDSRLGKYFDYDLSKMVNSKGGFLVEDDKEVDGDMRRKEKERERQRALQTLDPRKSIIRQTRPYVSADDFFQSYVS